MNLRSKGIDFTNAPPHPTTRIFIIPSLIFVTHLHLPSLTLLNPTHQRKLVINIGGQKFGSQILGGTKILGKFIFRQKILKNSLLFSPKFLTTFFLSHRQLFYKLYTFHSKCTPFSLYCCLCFCFLSGFFFLNKQN